VTTYLLDTNVVVRLMEPSAPEYPLLSNAIRRLVGDGHNLVLAPQVLAELWVVATRLEDATALAGRLPRPWK
jgi:predicted nucleic acid-binding protein